jgi:hypothetical protein
VRRRGCATASCCRACRHAEARALLSAVVAQIRRMPEPAQNLQAEWLAIAESALRA